ncbi:MAG: DUF2849 domain-containing protein [Rhodospirillales bacterium]|jgi:hypothetical protein|nr:DUF2849 domain-containing protein [Rhodospirillales bacterium]
MPHQVLTANRLSDGVVVFLDANGRWSEHIAAARVAEKDDADALTEAGEARGNEVVAPYLIDVALDAGGPQPLRYRERIRAFGPSIHPQFGK